MASIATTIVDEPKNSAASLMNSGRANAPELIATLSAPARRTADISFIVRIPPPTVRGINIFSAVLETSV